MDNSASKAARMELTAKFNLRRASHEPSTRTVDQSRNTSTMKNPVKTETADYTASTSATVMPKIRSKTKNYDPEADLVLKRTGIPVSVAAGVESINLFGFEPYNAPVRDAVKPFTKLGVTDR